MSRRVHTRFPEAMHNASANKVDGNTDSDWEEEEGEDGRNGGFGWRREHSAASSAAGVLFEVKQCVAKQCVAELTRESISERKHVAGTVSSTQWS